MTTPNLTDPPEPSRTKSGVVNSRCVRCDENRRSGNCARLRCYCGHDTCWAFDSYVPLKDMPTPALPTAADTRQAQSWANREEPTWLDR